MELTPAEIADLRAKITRQTIAARASGKPVVNLVILGGPLDGFALTLLDDSTNKAIVGWNVVQPTGPVTVMHRRDGNVLRFTALDTPGRR